MPTDKWRIKDIRVDRLLGRRDVVWHLHPKVNILGGPNGSGKSTVLHAMAMLLQNICSENEETSIHCEALFQSLVLDLYSGATLSLKRDAESTEEHYSTSDTPGIQRVTDKIQERVSFKTGISFPNGKPLMQTPCHVVYIHSSDQTLRRVTRLIEKTGMRARPALTVLDMLLEQALNERNQLFAGRLTVAMQNGNEEEVSNLRQLFSRFDEAVSKFMPEYRLVDTSALKFIHRDSPDEIIRYYKMSTGEKQLLYLLLTISNTLGESTILLLDEADTGMHVDWKKILLKELLNINPDMQVIAATHSPSLINGWYDNTREISQLYVKTEKGEGEKLNDVPEISE